MMRGIDILGYIASLLVLSSFLMKDIKKLRLVNIVGCAAFIVYAAQIENGLPVIVTNTAIVIINTVYLYKKK